MSNNEPYRTLSDRFNVSISSIFRVIRRVITWIQTKLDDVIKWPEGQSLIAIAQDFQNKKGISNCIGAIDGSHITILQPKENAADYCNRKKNYSIILQAVVTSDMLFTNIYCGEPGSLHDARVLRRSSIYWESENNKDRIFPNRTFILGDSAYPSLSWLVPPFKNNGQLTAQQIEFNFIHSSTRMAVEKTFGILKGRFRRLKFFNEYQDIQFIVQIVTACCILHNICIDGFDVGMDLYDEDNDLDVNLDERGNQREENVNDRRSSLFYEMFPQ